MPWSSYDQRFNIYWYIAYQSLNWRAYIEIDHSIWGQMIYRMIKDLIWWPREHHFHLNWVVDIRTCSCFRDNDDQLKKVPAFGIIWIKWNGLWQSKSCKRSFLISRDIEFTWPQALRRSALDYRLYNVLGMQININ